MIDPRYQPIGVTGNALVGTFRIEDDREIESTYMEMDSAEVASREQFIQDLSYMFFLFIIFAIWALVLLILS